MKGVACKGKKPSKMAKLTVREKEKRFRDAVDGVTQGFTSVTYAQVAERDYNDSNADSFADLDEDARAGHVDYVKREFTRKGRHLGVAAMARWSRPIARLIKGTDAYQPFMEAMYEIDLLFRVEKAGTVEFSFLPVPKSPDVRRRERLKQALKRAQRRLDADVSAQVDALMEAYVRRVRRSGGDAGAVPTPNAP